MKIVIVGGGTAGWIASLFIAQKNIRADEYKPYDITVIESPKIPIIGAGEGSTGAMVGLLKDKLNRLKGISQIEFLKRTNATIKLGINVKDWNGDGENFLEPLQPTSTAGTSVDIDYLLASAHGKSHHASPTGILWDDSIVPFYSSSSDNIDDGGGFAYHFDAHKVGEYFKEVAIENGVTHISAEVTETITDPITGNLSQIKLDNGKTINADLWLDCTGFARKLITAVGGEWKSYSDFLPCNKAMPYIHHYEDDEIIKPETLAWAMPNGWMWQIPTQERYGCGYVYSDKFTTDAQALKEMEEITGRKIEPLRVISFDPGRMKDVWVKNVMCVGLSSHFLEPLEATSIHATIVQIDVFTKIYLGVLPEETFYQTNINKYNEFFARMIDDYADLIRIHYVTKRQDSDFWRYVNNELPKTAKVEEIIDICKYRSPGFNDWIMFPGSAGWGVWATILTGLGILNKEIVCNSMWNNNYNVDSEIMYEKMLSHFLVYKKHFITHNELIKFIKRQK
jgi:flavin-dependent dehydrogenase